MKLIYLILLVTVIEHAKGDDLLCYVCDGDECNSDETITIGRCGPSATTIAPETTPGSTETTPVATETSPGDAETTPDDVESTQTPVETTPGTAETTSSVTQPTLAPIETTTGTTVTISSGPTDPTTTSPESAPTNPNTIPTESTSTVTIPEPTEPTTTTPKSTPTQSASTVSTTGAPEPTPNNPATITTESTSTVNVPGPTEQTSSSEPSSTPTMPTPLPESSPQATETKSLQKRSISASAIFINNYRRISRTRRDSNGDVSYSCYSIQYRDDGKVKQKKGCVAIPTDKSACEAIAEKVENIEADSCKPCVGNLCNSSSMFKLSVAALFVAIFVKILI